MKNIQNKIDTFRYGYSPAEFFPIMSGSELLNKRQFVAYKVRCLIVKRALV